MTPPPSPGTQMGTFHREFEKTAADDVRRPTKLGETSHNGDAARIGMMSNGEMGGSEPALRFEY